MDLADELRTAEKSAAENVAVPVDVLGQRVEHDVRAVLDRSLQGRRGEGAVDDDDQAGGMRQLGDPCDIQDVGGRVHRRFEVNHPAPRRDRLVEVLRLGEIDRNDLDAEARQPLVQHRHDVRVERAVNDKFVALRQQRQCEAAECRHPRSESKTRFGTFEIREAPLQDLGGRVVLSRVELAAECGCGIVVLHARKPIGRGHEDRWLNRVGVLGGVVSVVDRARVKAESPVSASRPGRLHGIAGARHFILHEFRETAVLIRGR